MSDEDIGVAPVLEDSAEAVQPEQPVEAEQPVEESAASEAPDDTEPEKPSRRDRRIDALTKRNYDAQRQLEAERQAREQLQAQMAQLQATQQQTPGENFPTLEQYNYDPDAYQNAVMGWHQQQVQAQESARQQQAAYAAQQQAAAQEQQRLQSAIAKGSEKYPDFVAKVMDPNLPPLREVNPAAFDAVMESDRGVDVAYYLANNPQQVYDFASLNQVQAIRKVAEIEASLAKKPMPGAVAPAPPTTLNGKAEAVKDPQKMSTDEWMAWRNNQIHKR